MTTYTKEQLKDGREVITDALENAFAKKDYRKLDSLTLVADKYGVNKSLRYKTWITVGEHWFSEQQYVESTIAFNAARRIFPLRMKIVQQLFSSLSQYVQLYRNDFTKDDLIKLNHELKRILYFYKINKQWINPSIVNMRFLSNDIDELIEFAPIQIEGPATHRTDKIVDSLQNNVSMDEVKAEFARIITPYLLEALSENEEKPKKKSKKKKKKEPEIEPDKEEKS